MGLLLRSGQMWVGKGASREEIMLPWGLGKNQGEATRMNLQSGEGMGELHFDCLVEPWCWSPQLPRCPAATQSLRVPVAGEGRWENLGGP